MVEHLSCKQEVVGSIPIGGKFKLFTNLGKVNILNLNEHYSYSVLNQYVSLLHLLHCTEYPLSACPK